MKSTMKKKLIYIFIMIFIGITVTKSCYCAIEIKPSPSANASNVLVSSTVSNSYLLCQGMTKQGESLYGSTVLPHLSTNADWGAVSYLSNSIYGTNSAGKNNGVKVTMNGVVYYSTTGNNSGVMNWGSNCYKGLLTQTAGIMAQYMSDNSTSIAKENVVEIEKMASEKSRYVDIIDTKNFTINSTLGMALKEVWEWTFVNYKSLGVNVNAPIMVRSGLFGFKIGPTNVDLGDSATGSALGQTTFRPVIWNK